MKSSWTPTRLGDLLVERRETPQPVDLASGVVRIVSKIGFNGGKLELRTGGDTNTPMILVQPGDLLVSGINAAKGAIAIYGETNQSPVAATIHYGAYSPRKDRVDTKFLWWLLRSGTFRELLLKYVPGGIKTELKAKRLLPIPIPLPPLPEQKRIVERIEELAGKIEEAKRLREEAKEATGLFLTSLNLHLADGKKHLLSDILKLDERKVVVEPGSTYPMIGIKAYGQGLFRGGSVESHRTTYKTFNRLFEGAVVLSQVKGWEGAVAVCENEYDGVYASPEYRTFSCVKGLLDYRYMAAIVKSHWFWSKLQTLTRGVGARRERIRPEFFLALSIEIPTLERQIQALELIEGCNSLKKLQAESSAELNALLPSILHKAFKGEL